MVVIITVEAVQDIDRKCLPLPQLSSWGEKRLPLVLSRSPRAPCLKAPAALKPELQSGGSGSS